MKDFRDNPSQETYDTAVKALKQEAYHEKKFSADYKKCNLSNYNELIND